MTTKTINLGISEEKLIQNILTQFLNENININNPLEDFFKEAETISHNHQLPEGYKFDRQEIYENED